jgi:chromate transport protein ChrA
MLRPFLDAVSDEVGAAVSRTKQKGAVIAAIAFFALAGVIFLLVTIYLVLAHRLGDVYAALIVAIGCFVLALVGVMAIKILEARQRRRLREMRDRNRERVSTVLTTAATAALPQLVKRPLVASALPIIGLAAFAFFFEGGAKSWKRRSSE